MKGLGLAYVVTASSFVLVDLVWLGLVARDLYVRQPGSLLRSTPDLLTASLFYLVYTLGITVFAVVPGLRAQSWRTACRMGGLLGLVAYATYDLTNLATLRNWPPALAVLDMAWGTSLTAMSAALGAVAARQAMGRRSVEPPCS